MNISEILGNVTFRLIDNYDHIDWYLELTDELSILLHNDSTRNEIAWKVSQFNTEDPHVKLAEILATKGKKSFAEGLVEIGDRVLEGKLKYVRELGSIHINRVGGYSSFGKDKILATKVGRINEWPGNPDIRIIQWSDGSHYYVKVNGIDVVVDNQQKWSTELKAKKALATWLKGKGNGHLLE